jgi:hypothetical protein
MKRTRSKKSRDTVPLSLLCETFIFTVPPAVALLNYMRSDTLSRIFPQTVIFAGFSIYHFFIAVRNSEAAMVGAGGAQRPVLRVKESKKIGERSARARTRGQNPLVICIIRHEVIPAKLLTYVIATIV